MKLILTIIMMFIVIGSVLEVSAEEFTYNEKILYAVESEKVTAHMIAIYDNFGKGGVYKELSKMHVDDIVKQDLEIMEKYYSEHTDFQDKLKHALFVIQNSVIDDEIVFVKQVKELFPLLNTGTQLITSGMDDDKFFRLAVVMLLLESAKMQYIESQEMTGLESLLKKQHGDTITIRAHMYLEDTNGIPTEMTNVIEQKFQKIFQLNDIYEVKIEQYDLLDKIKREIYSYMDKNEPEIPNKDLNEPEIPNKDLNEPEIPNKDLNEPEVIEQKITLDIDHQNGNSIVSFKGTGFPGGVRVDIKYATNIDKEIQHVKVRSLDNGTFYLPIEINPEEKTYFLSVEYLETVTTHIISNNA